MPTYEYKCLECKRTFELFQQMSESPVSSCQFCDGKVKRLIGAGAGIIFKGSGFYCTDYKNSSSPSKDTGDSSGSGEKKSSTPPAVTPAAPPAASTATTEKSST